MTTLITTGLLLVARGKLALVLEVIDYRTLSVSYQSTGETCRVDTSEVEFFDQSSSSTGLTSKIDINSSELSPARLEKAAIRWSVVQQWKEGLITNAQAANKLGVTLNHLYKIVRKCDDQLGSLALVDQVKGRKKGTRMLVEEVEKIIAYATEKTYVSRAATYSKVWFEVNVTCLEKGLICPGKQLVTNRVREILPEFKRSRIKLGIDAANQKHAARPGKKKVVRPLERVQMDHTLVDVHLLSNDRLHVIGRPWLTVVMDQYSRVLLGYYLSLYVPSAVAVASTLAHAVLPKDKFLETVGLGKDDYPYYGVPSELHMDNAAEFTSGKLKHGCQLFGIKPAYRPPGRKHYGGHIERIIGTFMTTKVHFLKGSTMSNVVARRNLQSEKEANMTFSDFAKWFAREVVVYHSTVHSGMNNSKGLNISPKQAWFDFFAPTGGFPFPPQVTDPFQFKLFFMPEDDRKIRPHGIEFKGQVYWDPALAPFIGTDKVLIKFDPYNLRQIWVKVEGRFLPIRLADLTKSSFSLEEYKAAAFFRETVQIGALTDENAAVAYREKQNIESDSAKLTKAERRRQAAADVYRTGYNMNSDHEQIRKPVKKPDYSRPPTKFTPGD